MECVKSTVTGRNLGCLSGAISASTTHTVQTAILIALLVIAGIFFLLVIAVMASLPYTRKINERQNRVTVVQVYEMNHDVEKDLARLKSEPRVMAANLAREIRLAKIAALEKELAALKAMDAGNGDV